MEPKEPADFPHNLHSKSDEPSEDLAQSSSGESPAAEKEETEKPSSDTGKAAYQRRLREEMGADHEERDITD